MRRTVLLFAFVLSGILLVTGVAFARVISCSVGAAECEGTRRADTMHGTSLHDKMLGKGGDDVMYGGDGNDGVKGKVDDDKIFGGPADDLVKGGNGRDRIKGGEGDDIVRGGSHSVTNDGSVDVLRCGPGKDDVYYTPGVDVVSGCEVKHPSR
jgi:Ca2+-binding RTX toxin-like protein